MSIAVNAVNDNIDSRQLIDSIDSRQQSTAVDSSRQHPTAIDSIDSYQQPQHKGIVIDYVGE